MLSGHVHVDVCCIGEGGEGLSIISVHGAVLCVYFTYIYVCACVCVRVYVVCVQPSTFHRIPVNKACIFTKLSSLRFSRVPPPIPKGSPQ